MRNVKRLWGVIAGLAICMVVLICLLIARSSTQPDHNILQHTQEPNINERVVAKIGNREFTLGDLQKALEKHHGAEMLNQLLDREAIRLEGIEAGIQIKDSEIERELRRMQQGYQSEAQFYEAMVEQLGMTKEELREDVYYKLLLEAIATRNVTVSDIEVNEYIRTHPDEFKNKVELDIQQIIVPDQEQANKVLAEIAKGADFAILARDRSLDHATANGGGELGWVVEDDPFVPLGIMNAAKGLKVGGVSTPITVDNGLAIIRLRNRREKSNPDASFIRETVRKELALQQAPPLKDVVKSIREKRGAVITDPAYQP
jgi:foldase protein PrsA